MNFEELGLTLQREREKKGLSIEAVMEATKISRTNIVAMENGDKASLPHPVYTKGFVKSYARYLGLDAVELIMVVDREYQEEADGPEEHIYEVSAAAEKAFQEADAPESKKKKTWPLLLVFLFLVIIIILLVMNLNSKDSAETVEKEAPALVEETAPPAPPVPEATETEEQSEAEEMAAIAEEAAAPEQAAEKTDEQMNADVIETEAKPEPVPAPKSEPATVPKVEAKLEEQEIAPSQAEQLYDHVLVIRATTDKGCWIGLWKGDETRMFRDYVLKEGEPLRLMFNSPRRIRIGNVAGVTVTYNGKPYELDGATSNIQTLRFGE